MRIGLFFGSFNPVHIGHLIIANTMLGEVEQVWFVVSPQNPFKKKRSLLHAFDRLDMVREAIADNPAFRASDVEFHMPQPSYTADTLAYLSDKYPQHEFFLIMGGDNLPGFHRWKNAEAILEHYGILVYPRPGATLHPLQEHARVCTVEAPLVDISATYIRRQIQQGGSIRYLVPQAVEERIRFKRFYL